jgi:hypothetical protein
MQSDGLISTQRPHTFAQTCHLVRSFSPCSRAADHTFLWFARCLRYVLARRVCRRYPLPRRLDRICGRGPGLAVGTGVRTSQRRAADSGKESVRPKGGGCLERGTLNADRKANRKGVALFDGLSHGASCKNLAQKLEESLTIQQGRMTRGRNDDANSSAHLLAFSIVLWMEAAH